MATPELHPEGTERTSTELTVRSDVGRRLISAAEFQQLAEVPAAAEWLANVDNPNTRRAYRRDVEEFMSMLGIRHFGELRDVRCAHVITWRKMLEARGLGPATRSSRPRSSTACCTTSTSSTSTGAATGSVNSTGCSSSLLLTPQPKEVTSPQLEDPRAQNWMSPNCANLGVSSQGPLRRALGVGRGTGHRPGAGPAPLPPAGRAHGQHGPRGAIHVHRPGRRRGRARGGPVVRGDPEGLSRIIRAERPALVLLDLMLPGSDGIELMKRVPELAYVPFLRTPSPFQTTVQTNRGR